MKKSLDDLLAKTLDDAFKHLRMVLEGRLSPSERTPPKRIERLIGEQLYDEIMQKDYSEIRDYGLQIESLNLRIKFWTYYRGRLVEQCYQAEKSGYREYGDVTKREIEPKIKYLNDEIEFLTDHRDRVVEARDKSEKHYNRKYSAAAIRAIEKISANLTWAQCVPELKPGRKTRSSDSDRHLRKFVIVEEFNRRLAEYPGTRGRGLKTRLINEMVEELKQAGKLRIGKETVRKILAAAGIK